MKHFISTILFLYLVTWFLASLYFGIARIVNNSYYDEVKQIPKTDFQSINNFIYDGINFKTKGDYETAIIADRVWSIYKWTLQASDALIFILSCCFSGSLGIIIRLLKDFIIDDKQFKKQKMFLFPILGFLLGLVILALSYAIPNYLTSNNDITLNPASIAVLCLLSGIYFELFLTWLFKLSQSIFNTEKNT